VIRQIEALRFAQEAGFTLGEVKTLFHGFSGQTSLSARWRSLARTKRRELELLDERVRRMRRALELGSRCRCVRIEDCSLSPAGAPEPRRRRGGSR